MTRDVVFPGMQIDRMAELLDEPFGSLDARVRQQDAGLNASGRTRIEFLRITSSFSRFISVQS